MVEPDHVDLSAVREPFYGSTLRMIGLAAMIGGPVWVVLTAILHAAAVRDAYAAARELRAAGVVFADSDEISVLDIAINAVMLASAGAQALALTALLLVVIGLGVVIVRRIGAALEASANRSATAAYRDVDATLHAGAWDGARAAMAPDDPPDHDLHARSETAGAAPPGAPAAPAPDGPAVP